MMLLCYYDICSSIGDSGMRSLVIPSPLMLLLFPPALRLPPALLLLLSRVGVAGTVLEGRVLLGGRLLMPDMEMDRPFRVDTPPAEVPPIDPR